MPRNICERIEHAATINFVRSILFQEDKLYFVFHVCMHACTFRWFGPCFRVSPSRVRLDAFSENYFAFFNSIIIIILPTLARKSNSNVGPFAARPHGAAHGIDRIGARVRRMNARRNIYSQISMPRSHHPFPHCPTPIMMNMHLHTWLMHWQ